jgi:hypothetical protein
MSEAYDYESLHDLVNRLNPAQARHLRLLVTQDEELSQLTEPLPAEQVNQAEPVPEGLLALIGSVSSGRGDMAERHDD